MSASHAIQVASIFNLLGQPFGDRFCTIYQLLLVVLATFFYIGLFSNHYFLDLAYLTPSSRLWGKPCTVSSTSHSPSLLEPVPIQPPLTWSHCVSFRLHYSPACNSSQIFYFIDIFSMHIFLDFSQFTPRRRQRGKSSTSSPAFDSLLLLECTPCHITVANFY
jgi:hypothetical protein